jgi:Pyruvate/2-oxoacid:ferredoxin oxidoreductase gamma subunit
MVKENFAAKPKLVDLNVDAFETGYEQGQKARQKYYGQGDQSVS